MKIKYKKIIIIGLMTMLFSACGQRPAPSTSTTSQVQNVGYASWYGGKFHGRKTASGEIYDQDLMTAAHKTLSFGTLVRVTNLDNGKKTIVKINDRGPFVKGRIIDLSREAARRIDMLSTGTAKVKLEFLTQAPANQGQFIIQTGSFSDPENAQMQQRDITAKFPTIRAQVAQNKGFFKVHLGPYTTNEKAQQDLDRIRRKNFDGIILQL
ncbi:MAG: septal ring lytic transglycosylase RlpA family protein [Bdellovibrionota bacterium]